MYKRSYMPISFQSETKGRSAIGSVSQNEIIWTSQEYNFFMFLGCQYALTCTSGCIALQANIVNQS